MAANQFDQLIVTGNITLADALDVILFGGFTPSVGQSWEFLDIVGTLSGLFSGLGEGSWVGMFESTNLLITCAGGDGNDVVLTSAALLSGDYSFNGVVDAADDVVGRDRLGAPAGTLPNDTAGGVVGQAQYDLWKANFGATWVPPGAGAADFAAAAPEPTAAAMLIMAAVVVCLPRRRSA